MRVLMGSAVVFGIVLGGVGLVQGARAERAPVKVVQADLSGHWVLNEKLSDKLGPAGGAGRGGAGGGPPGGMNGAGPGGPPPSPEDGAPGESVRGPGRARMLRDMVVEQYEDQLLLSERGKVERIVLVSSGDVPRLSPQGVPQVRAAWNHGRLVIDETTPRGRVLETWELAKGGTQLVVLTRIQRGEDSFDRKRVYNRMSERQ